MDRERAARDLAAIRRLMEESRGRISGTGRHWVLWGAVTVVGLVATWSVLAGVVEIDPLWIWGGVLAAGWAGSFWMGRRSARRGEIGNDVTRLVHRTWMGLGVSMTILALGGMLSPLVDPRALPALFSAVVGAGVFATGAVAGLGWLRWIAAGWWLGAVLLLWIPDAHALLVMAVMVVALEVVPGVVLERRGGGAGTEPMKEPA